MLKTVRISEASWRVMEEHSKDLKVWREELRTIAELSLKRNRITDPFIVSNAYEVAYDGS